VISELDQMQDTGRLTRLNDRERRRAAPAGPSEAGRYLAVDSGGEEVHLPVQAAVTRIGRGMSADVRLDDPTVSRRHALVAQRDGECVLLDDRSMNGTWLNGERIQEARLQHGDLIELGAVRLRFLDVPASS
jgi:pSer/pThr/pTyr-binding forkhead associated (FHA) protein